MTPLSLFYPQNTGQLAILSPCRRYRYALERRWGGGSSVLFIGLNPSTADEYVDDPTIRRCIGFAKDWGYGGLLMGNLYGYRATRPVELEQADDPVGPDNDTWLMTLDARAALTIAAWGAHPLAKNRVGDVLEWLGSGVCCLARSKNGAPRHPLYLPKTVVPEPFSQPKPEGVEAITEGTSRSST